MSTMTSPATEEACKACALLGHPCRSHDIPAVTPPPGAATRPTSCGIDGCPNPTLHSHSEREKAARAAQREEIESVRGEWPHAYPSVKRTLPTCPYVCFLNEEHTHTEEGGIQRRYRPRYSADPVVEQPPACPTFGRACTIPGSHQHVVSHVDYKRPSRAFTVPAGEPVPDEARPGDLIVRPTIEPEEVEGKAFVGKTDCGHPVSHMPHSHPACSGLVFDVQEAMVPLSEVPDLPGFNPDLSPHLMRPSIDPEEVEPDPTHQPGDWVLVWAQVSEDRTHPEDLRVVLRSHNSDYGVPVLRGCVERTTGFPEDAERCSHLALGKKGAYERCVRYLGPGHQHRDRTGRTWTDDESVGYIEEA